MSDIVTVRRNQSQTSATETRLLLRVGRIVLTAALLALVAPGGLIASDYHPSRLIVKFRPGAASSQLNKVAAVAGARTVEPLVPSAQLVHRDAEGLARVKIVEFNSDSTRAVAESILAADPAVEYVERDYYMQLFADPLFPNQWGLVNTGQPYLGIVRIPGFENDSLRLFAGTPGADIGWGQVSSAPADRSRVRVAIIDTGVDYHHPDLQGHIWHNPAETNGIPGFDDDFNGYIDDTVGYDFSGDVIEGISVSPDPDPVDTIGHGTHVAGIVGAVAGNGIGIEGVARNVEVMCLKIFPNALASASAQAIIYAVNQGAKVINASWGSPYYSTILAEAVQYAADRGVVFVAAAGNSGTSTPFFPARLDHVLTVGATGSADRVTTFSTYGDWLDVAAPGENILSLRAARTDLYAAQGEPQIRIIDEFYYLADGTSMAAPHVAGAAAFILSVAPGLPRDSVEQLLKGSADKIADPDGRLQGNFSPYAGWGRINLGRAVGLLQDEYAEIESPHPNALVTGVVNLRGSAVSQLGSSFVLEVRPAATGDWTTIASGPGDIVRNLLASWDSSPYDGDADLRLRVGTSIAFTMAIRIANSVVVELLTPHDGDTVYSVANIVGSASSPTFDSYRLTYAPESNPKQETLIKFSTEISYRRELAEWTVGQLPPGRGLLTLTLTDDAGEHAVSNRIVIKSTVAAGYPLALPARPHLTSAAGNLDADPGREIVTGSRAGLLINDYDQPGLRTIDPHFGNTYESSPALCDLDNDGRDEIVSISDRGVIVVNGEGESLPGWPKAVNTGLQFNSYPTPLVADLDGDGEMEILFVNSAGEIYCWRADGSSYFRTTRGLFARLSESGRFKDYGGSTAAFLFAYDFDGDGYRDVGTLYTAAGADGGVYLYSGKNGAPYNADLGARIFSSDGIFGGVLADFDNDAVPEIAFAHWYSSNLAMAVRIIEADGSDLPGWPKLFPEKIQWLTSYPAAADLDNDSIPELICAFSALDGGEVFVWHGDGRPLLASEFGRNDGFLAGTINSLSNPLVLDVDNDGQFEIVSRGGALLIGKPERLLCWETDGTTTPGWPVYTFANPGVVTYAPHTPVVGDFDGDSLLEIYIGSSDGRIYSWDLPTVASDSAVAWGTFLGDARNTGLLPSLARPRTPQPPPLPTTFRLAQNYPNPFNQTTVIEVDVVTAAPVKIEIFNLLGQTVATVVDRFLPAGFHRFEWDGRDFHGQEVASGVYFYRLRMNNVNETRRMVLLK